MSELSTALDRARPSLVLVDCFGTLLHRRAPSGRVRELAAVDLTNALNGVLDPDELVERRLDVERQLSRELSSPGCPRDHRLPDVARALYERWSETVGIESEEFCRLFCDVEVAAEIGAAQLNHPLVRMLNELDAGVPVWVVSDTNLTGPMLRSILDAKGLHGRFERIVASSDAGETKRSGRLYPLVVDSARGLEGAVVMIGDNPEADGAQASEAGLQALTVRSGRWDTVKATSPERLRSDVAACLRDILAPRGDEVFPEFALTLWLFTTRLSATLRHQGAERAVFLAREGLFLREIFDRAQQRHLFGYSEPIPSAYLLTSRKATLLPSLVDVEAGLGDLLRHRPDLTLADFEAVTGVSVADPSSGVGDGRPLTRSDLDILLRSGDVRRSLDARQEEQRTLLHEIVDAADARGGTLHTIDVGWKGTVRDHLARSVDRPVHAHLIGLLGSPTLTEIGHKAGHLFANVPRRSPWFQVFSHFKELYEHLLAAPHGSVSSYARGAGGEAAAILDDHEGERDCHTALIAPFQRSCMERFDEVAEILAVEREPQPWLERLVALHHARALYRPRDVEIDFVEGLAQYENYGAGVVKEPGRSAVDGGGRFSLRRHVGGGGWPPLRMRQAGAGWQRYPYGVYKRCQLWRGQP